MPAVNTPVNPTLPDYAAGTSVLVNALDEQKTLPDTLRISHGALPIRVPTEELPSEDGVQRTGLTRKGVLTQNISGTLIASTKEALRDLISDWRAFFYYDPLQLFAFTAADDRYTLHSCTAFNANSNLDETSASVSIELQQLDPYAYAPSQSSAQQTINSDSSMSVSNDGNARCYPSIEFYTTTAATNIALRNSVGVEVRFLGSLGAGKTLICDCSRQTATIDDAGQLSLMGTDFFKGFYLKPGTNSLLLTCEGASSIQVTVRWTNRWH